MTSIRRPLDAFRRWLGLQRIIDHYRSSGLEHPVNAALDEIDMRVEMERFRDFASEQVLETERSLGEIADKWSEVGLKPLAKPLGYKKVQGLKAAIKAMPPAEALHPLAYEVWCRRIDDAARRNRSLNIPGRQERQALRERVLRSP